MRIILSALLLTLALHSCSNAPDKKTENSEAACNKYACPMHPDKTSAVPATCPQCGMQMAPDTSKSMNQTPKQP